MAAHKTKKAPRSREGGNLIIVSAPSGAGKTTIVQGVQRSLEGVKASISFTSRPPRLDEVNGVDYHFVSRDDFKDMINAGEFLEWAEVHSNLYGTSREIVREMLSKGLDVILTIDIQGAEKARELFTDAISIFVLPPSVEILAERLTGRGGTRDEEFELRMANAQREMHAYREYDFLIVNDDLGAAIREFEAVVLASRCRRLRRTELAELILEGFRSG